MIYRELSLWIAQSESWQSFVDYNVPPDEQVNYTFLQRREDFYISLLSELQEALESFYEDESDENKKDLLSIAKGLEIYSLKNKREQFQGVSYSRNMLYVATLYYLADFPATSLLILKQFDKTNFTTSIELFIYYFLSRNYQKQEASANPYFSQIVSFLRFGDANLIENLKLRFNSILDPDNQIESHLFVLTYVSRSILKKFSTNNLWSDLQAYGENIEWKTFIRFNINKTPQIWSFFPSQQTAIRQGLLTFERSFSLQTPTSSGKTFIGELIIYNEFKQNPNAKILYLAPFRALASELKGNLGINLSKLGIRIKTIYGGNIITPSEQMRIEQSNVLISTPEKFMAIESGLLSTLDHFQLVICDEGHLIDNRTRGISYELLLSRLKKTERVNRRFVFLSAIIPNIEVINSWLGGSDNNIAKSNYRPTEIELAFLEQKERFRFDLEVNPQETFPGKFILKSFLSQQDFATIRQKVYKPATIKSQSVSAALKTLNSGAVAIFSPTKDKGQGVAGLAQEVIDQNVTSLPKPLDFCNDLAVKDLSQYFNYVFGSKFLLVTSIENGFLYHHGDLPQFIRELIEKYVRNEQVKFLICTSTLAEGINLPIKTLVVHSLHRFDQGSKRYKPLISNRDLKNLIGRAGRAGKETKGTIIVSNPKDRNTLLNVFANRQLEDVKGFLFYVVEAIENYIVRQRTNLSNELLDTLEESDYIDNSIIQLLAEDISVEGLDTAVRQLIENTLTFYQSDEKLKARLRDLFSLRSERVKAFVENSKIGILRQSGFSLRVFSQIEVLIDYKQEFLATVTEPLNSDWLRYLLDLLFDVESFVKSIPGNISKQQLVIAIKIWISGGWYNEIAQNLEVGVDDILRLIKFFEFTLQNFATSVIRYIQIKREEIFLGTSSIILQWTEYLLYGLGSRLQLDLTEIAVGDRIIVLQTSTWFSENLFPYENLEELRSILINNKASLSTYIETRVPRISIYSLNDFYNQIYNF